MLTIRTHVAPSLIHGLGLFADERIAAGRITWEYDSRYDRIYYYRTKDSLPKALRSYAFDCGKGICLSADNDRFTNHSDTPNLHYDRETMRAFAIRDIEIGEELTQDYAEIGGM